MTRNLRYALISCQRIASSLISGSTAGSIVNISSIATRAVLLLTGYGAAKASSKLCLEPWHPNGGNMKFE